MPDLIGYLLGLGCTGLLAALYVYAPLLEDGNIDKR